MKLSDVYRMLAKDLEYAVENLIRADAPCVLVQEIAELATHMREVGDQADGTLNR